MYDERMHYWAAAREKIDCARDDRRLAIHEAGHSVVALSLGWEVPEATIARATTIAPPYTSPAHWIQVGLAGAVAVFIDNGRKSVRDALVGASKDLDQVEGEFVVLVPELERPRVRSDGWHAALAILDARWARVGALATALISNSRLTAEQVRAIVDPPLAVA
jgi:hypothetical protein